MRIQRVCPRLRGACAIALVVLLAAGTVHAQERLDIHVVPRMGAFNHLAFKTGLRPEAGRQTTLEPGDEALVVPKDWRPRTWKDYLSQAEDKLKKKLNPSGLPRSAVPDLAEEWDVITTSQRNTGYAHRRALLRVLGAPKGALCSFRVGTATPQPPLDCAGGGWAYVSSNLAVPVTARVESDPTGAAPRDLQPGTVPEDFLIVAMGDSFLSGQGNPDGRKTSAAKWADCVALTSDDERDGCLKGIRHKGGGAMWMDERCQRSGWSLPIQTGVRLLGAMPQQRGAITVVSFACSGAKVGDGLNAEYEGQLNFADFVARTDSAQWSQHARSALAQGDKLRPQKEAVRHLLNDQDAAASKKTIDLLLLDGGGNDVGFSHLVTDLVISKSDSGALDAYKLRLGPKFHTLQTESYKDLANGLSDFRVRHSILLPYPDPTRREDNTGCGGMPVDSATLKVASRVFRSIYNIFASDDKEIDAEIQPAEAIFAGKNVLDPLNDGIAAFATRLQWAYVNQWAALLKGKGWCAEGTGKDFFDTSKRWIRKVDESFHLQGDVYGSMHPTWEYHDKAAEVVALFALAATTRDTQPDFKAAHAPQATGAGWVAGTLSVSTASAHPSLICDIERSSCTASPATFSYPHGSKAPEFFRVVDVQSLYQTWVKSPYAGYNVDAERPRQTCWVKGPKSRTRCADVQYLSGVSEILLETRDPDSGVARVALKAGSVVLGEGASATISTVDHRVLPNGPLEVTALAVDSVGNGASKTYSFVLDTVPPELTSIGGRPYRAGQEALVVHRTTGATVAFGVRDDGTGPCELQFLAQSNAMSATTAPSQNGADCGSGTAPAAAPSNTRTFQVAFRPYASALKEVELVELAVMPRDFAGNAADPAAHALKVAILPSPGCQGPCVRPAKHWNHSARLNEVDKLRAAGKALGTEVPAMTAVGTSEADVVAASWFNFLSGRFGGTQVPAPKALTPDCQLQDGASDAYSSLLNMRACMGKGVDLKAAAVAMKTIPKQ